MSRKKKLNFKPFNVGRFFGNKITLRPNGVLYVNDSVINASEVKEPASALLFIDEMNRKIGIKFSEDLEKSKKHSRKVMKEKGGVAVRILPALRYFGVNEIKQKESFPFVREEGLIVIDVPENE